MNRALGSPVLVSGECAAVLERVTLQPGKGEGYSEAWLQRLIHNYPACLPIDDIEPGFGMPVAVCMELPTAHGPIDNVLLTPEGNIVLVEAKLWRNPQARREVVAQALDYASCLFSMDYEALEAAALKGVFTGPDKPSRLYDLMPGDALDEAAFIDAVNANLRRGRILIIVAGDGIRTEVERLADSLQSHAGFHFTLALVELAVFGAGGPDSLLVLPRTVAKTVMIERGVVRVDDRRTTVVTSMPSPSAAPTAAKPLPGTISSEQFFEEIAKRNPEVPAHLQRFLNDLLPLGIAPEFRRSLILRWTSPAGSTVNLGYIKTNGELWTDLTSHKAPKALAHRYVQELADALGFEVDTQSSTGACFVAKNGKPPRIDAILDKLDAWQAVIENFVTALRSETAQDS
ncbi:hypothetical protein IGS68_15720 [Skermanella sp. TT6]|uniref:DUF91 domain-containing protein n=1 Tax=Skermanella cutis TaxID=2775420 RepID=A0ABX7AZW0_9PROT|nr:hypothetical protein [Skermanella sp. TT6]QQP87548.1 hypothetical protein IGS68_15720 [Skermanella sp. TT6]